jgi:4,5-dihydroxyphthalate decarboxylase
VLTWFNTAALWARGTLQHEYGVDITKIHWLTGEAAEVNEPTLPPGVRLTAGDSSKFTAMLLAGEIDALITPRTPSRDHAPTIVRLFPDFRTVEEAYYRKTGAFPVSHALVVRKPLLEQHPWLAERLFEACTKARRLAAEYADDPEHSTLAWYGAQMEHEAEVLGPDAGTYGIEANRKTLETLVTYGYAAGFLPRRPAIEELFHASTRTLVASG